MHTRMIRVGELSGLGVRGHVMGVPQAGCPAQGTGVTGAHVPGGAACWTHPPCAADVWPSGELKHLSAWRLENIRVHSAYVKIVHHEKNAIVKKHQTEHLINCVCTKRLRLAHDGVMCV